MKTKQMNNSLLCMRKMNNSLQPFLRKMKHMTKCGKKMRKNRGCNGAIYNSILNDDDDILCEILSRLPAKTLMRFKCVCKRWQSLIQHDPYFIDLHSTRSITRPSLFLAGLIENGMSFNGKYLLSANLFEDRAAVHTKLNLSGSHYHIRDLINGLICLLDWKRLAVRIYNISTRQITPWIKRTIRKKELEEEHGVGVHHEGSTFWFGFDPVTKKHKVICLSTIRKIKTLLEGERKSDVTVCDVLTIGDNSWRKIDEVPPYDLKKVFVYANGSIYWRKVKQNMVDSFTEEPEVIVAFDVGLEKFRVIRVPDFILHQPPKCDAFGRCCDLLEVDGCVALLHRVSGYIVKLWIFDETTASNNWIEETITLPFCWEGSRGLYFQAVAGTDQIIIVSDNLVQFSSLHSYDRKVKTFKKIEISGIPVQTLNFCYMAKPFVENLMPVQNQQVHHSTRPLP